MVLNKRGSQKSKVSYVNALIIMIPIISAIVFVCNIGFSIQPCRYSYRVTQFSMESKVLEVSLEVSNLFNRKSIELYEGSIKPFDLICVDDKSRKANYIVKDGIIKIMANDKSTGFNFSYKVKIGDPGKHGHRGQLYEDLMTFDGDSVLILPLQAYNMIDKDIKKDIANIAVEYDIPGDWASVIPFDKPVKNGAGNHMTLLYNPTWSKIYELRKSCYAFGKFEKKEYKKGNGVFSIYVDHARKQIFDAQVEKSINNLYDYFAGLFGYNLPDFKLVLLRKDAEDGMYLMGGSGGKTLGTTFDGDNSRDWELMGHRFFHAFFEDKVSAPIYHRPPQLWFFEGLATYYENMSMESLPTEIKNKLDINVSENFALLFKRYVYMRLKDQSLLSIAPMNEESIQDSGGLTEFLHYTQAPIVIKAMEDITNQIYKTHDKAIKFIIDNCNRNDINVNNIVKNSMGYEADTFIKHFLLSDEILPFPQMQNTENEDPAKVIKAIEDIEYTLWTWFRLENPNYPRDAISAAGLKEMAEAAEKEGIHFADEDMERIVKDLSPTVYELLKQYEYKAKN